MSDREDLEARTGSSTALLRTVVGSVLRPLGGWMTASGAVGLLGALDVPASTARSSLARLCAGGVLVREPRDGVAGYALDPAAVTMLERGDRRIFDRRLFDRRPNDADGWCLVSFSIPEGQRARRHQLRRRLAALGCGTVADGLWIAPRHLEDEVDRMLAELGLQSETVLFTDARTRGSLSGTLERWYDLDRIRAAHDGFLRQFGGGVAAAEAPAGAPPDLPTGAPADDRAAFAEWIRVLDEWRVIPYLDPGLPASALPADWPAAASAARFAALRSALEPRALAHARRAAL